MPQIKWREMLNMLTLKGRDSGSLMMIKDSAEDIVKFKICHGATMGYLKEWLAESMKGVELKSALKSEELRLAGNKVYKKGQDKEALNCYNASLVFAPYGSSQYYIALGNRSAVLLRLGLCQEALKDINLALHNEDLGVTKQKLLKRKAVLLNELSLFEECIKVIELLKITEEDMCKNENQDLKKAYYESLENQHFETEGDVLEPETVLPSLKGGESQVFPSASVYAKLERSEKKGRHVIAAEDFEIGDYIFVEKPFALIVLPDQYWQHCHNCCKQIVAYIPCKQCTEALFCGEECRESAWARYHRWECGGLIVCHSVGIAHLGLRVALLADDSERYQQVYDLVTNIDHMKPEDIYQYAATAVLLTLYLEQYTSYFKDKTSLTFDEMGSRILRHIAQLVCNGHAITKIGTPRLQHKSSKTETQLQMRIATAIYPSASMMNHSCNQNILNSFINEHLIVTSTKTIKKGEEVLNCYGPHYTRMSKSERQVALQSQYFFKCDCQKCQELPANTKDSHHQYSALLCSFCTGPVLKGQATCANCTKEQPLMELVNMALSAHKLFKEGRILMNESKWDPAIKTLKECVSLSSKSLYKHNSDLRKYKDTLAKAYAEVERYYDSIELVEECLVSIEKQFGKDSPELCVENIKLFDLVALDMKQMAEKGLKDSNNYRNKCKKLIQALYQAKRIREDNRAVCTFDSDLSRIMELLGTLDLRFQ